MDKLRKYVSSNFEQFFVLLILLFTSAVNHIIDQKLAFLNFYFLPIILAGYYLGTRKSVFGSIFCTLLVLGYVILDPSRFKVQYSETDMYLHLAVWACFLILAGAVVGKQHEKLTKTVQGILTLNKSLQEKQAELNDANEILKTYSSDLEGMVTSRTSELENSKRNLEILKSKVETTLYSTMDASVAKLLIEGRLRSDKRKVSVMFSDLAGFTSYSEDLNPEVVVQDLNQYLSVMEPILMDYHGHIDKFLGDGIMAEFGAPIDYAQYRLLAVITGIKMQEKMREIDLPWKLRIGIASGSAITGLIGSKRQAYTSIGDVVNIASRLETQCPTGEFLIDDYTFEGVERYVNAQPFHLLGAETVENRERIVKIEELKSLTESCSDLPQKAKILKETADIYLELGESEAAYELIQTAVQAQPDDPTYKVAIADLIMDREKKGQLKVKGRKKLVKAYKVLGLIDSLDDPQKIPTALYEKYRPAIDAIPIPQDFTLKIEAIDGSIGHSRGVALLSYAMATKLNVFDKENSDILLAAFAADLGKEIVPHHILNRNGPLSTSEISEVQKHPMESVRILKSLGYHSESILEIIRHSHERIDGSGYPDGLKGDEIPLGSRIIAVADAFDALTSWRPYREKWDGKAALDELKKSVARGWYDGQVIDVLTNMILEHADTSAGAAALQQSEGHANEPLESSLIQSQKIDRVV